MANDVTTCNEGCWMPCHFNLSYVLVLSMKHAHVSMPSPGHQRPLVLRTGCIRMLVLLTEHSPSAHVIE